MKRSLMIFLLGIFSVFTAFSQQTTITGSVKDAVSNEPISNVTVTIEETQQFTQNNQQKDIIHRGRYPRPSSRKVNISCKLNHC